MIRVHVEREQESAAFDGYVARYDLSDPKIELKRAHSHRVAELCDRIARGLGWPDGDVDLAWHCGLLHDIGRFEQVRRHGTFDDARSCDHAVLGVRVLFGDGGSDGSDGAGAGDEPADGREGERETESAPGRIRDFCDDGSEDALVRTAIAQHNRYAVDASLDERTRRFCEVLRDADKIDIVRVNCECPVEDIYGIPESEMRASRISPEVVRAFYREETLDRSLRRTPADYLVGHLCFAYGLVFPVSRQIIAEQGYLAQMLARRFDDPATQETFERMGDHLRAWLPSAQ